MKFSYHWLRDLVEGFDTPPADLLRLITLKTAECEGLEPVGADYVIEVDNKSLTHRPDLWGHHGMAREVAAITGKKLRDPVRSTPPPEAPAPVSVEVEDFSLCPRYSALVFENVTVKPSPAWLQQRLEAVALNAINNIVDVTNFVMAELAQPMHAFDADKLHGGKIIVRAARAGEKIAALNGETYELDLSNLVIADPEGAIAIAGVIGGADSAISESTTRIVLESANFNASSIRKTSSRLKLRTDASMRFEKAQDPVNTVRGLKRALDLLEEVSPGIRLVGGLADEYRPLPAPAPIELQLDWLDRKVGRAVPVEEVVKIFESLDFRVEQKTPRALSVHVPSWRATKDVTIKDDLVEEIGRMVGYDSIAPAAPRTPATVPPANPERAFHHRVRAMAAAQGFTEVYNYSFISEDQARMFGLTDLVEVANPIASDQTLLRPSLLPGIYKNILDNQRHFDSFRLFEIGREIHCDGEIPHFTAAIYSKEGGAAGLFELKRLAECLLAGARVVPVTHTIETKRPDEKLVAVSDQEQASIMEALKASLAASEKEAAPRSYEHPQRAGDVYQGGTRIGRLFEFHPKMVETGRAAVLDLYLTLLEKLQPATPRYQPLRKFPASAFDLSVIAPARMLVGDVQARLASLAGETLIEIVFLRDFALLEGWRSLSYRLTVGAPDRTLSSDEVAAIRAGIISGMRAGGYELKV